MVDLNEFRRYVELARSHAKVTSEEAGIENVEFSDLSMRVRCIEMLELLDELESYRDAYPEHKSKPQGSWIGLAWAANPPELNLRLRDGTV